MGRQALVRWLNGKWEGSLTHNVPLPWIKDFDEENFKNESFLVKWKQLPKPKSGWPTFDCVVLDVSDDEDYLMSRKRSLEEAERRGTPTRSTDLDRSRSADTTPKQNFSQSDMRDIILQTLARMGSNVSSSSEGPSPCQVVKKVGTCLILSNTAYIEAKAAASPSTMTMNLVRNSFSKARLRRSSYAGQRRGDRGKPGLKKYKKMQDIQDFVKSRFPHFTQSQFGAAVNKCLGNNVDRTKERVLCDESDSDPEI